MPRRSPTAMCMVRAGTTTAEPGHGPAGPRPPGGTVLAPTAGAERIGLLDALRGFALAGIFVVNIEWFTRPWQEFGTGMAPGLAGADQTVAWVVHVLFAGKFWVLFSLLFGMGFALMMERAGASARGARVHLRRMVVLFVIGIAHALLVWVGDILHSYAIAGLLLLALRGMAPAARLGIGLVLYLGLYGLSLLAGIAVLASGGPTDASAAGLGDGARAAEAEAAAAIYAAGDFAGITAQRLRDFLGLAGNLAGVVPVALGVFLVGSWLLDSGRLVDVPANRGFLARMAAACLPLGLLLTLAGAMLAGGQANGLDGARHVVASSLHALGALPMTLGGVAALALAWQHPAGARLLGALVPAGRMALTNYLSQSLVASLVFYGYGLALWGRIGYPGLVLLALLVFAAQALASRWWLRRYRHGPLEWAWRWLSYGRRPPMRNPSHGA